MFKIFQNENTFCLMRRGNKLVLGVIGLIAIALMLSAMGAVDINAFAAKPDDKGGKFHLEEATIPDIHNAIKTGRITTTELVHLYLHRIKAYNGVCVNQPEGILGPISTIPNAGQLNALMTLNLRPDTRKLGLR